MKTSVRICSTVKSDCLAVLEVTFLTPMSRESSWWLNTMEPFEARLASGGGFIVEADGRIIGYIIHAVSDTDLVLRGLAVWSEFENQGIGTVLVEATETKARARDLSRVLLVVNAPNFEVCGYYLCLGYVVSKEPYAHVASGCSAPVVFIKEL